MHRRCEVLDGPGTAGGDDRDGRDLAHQGDELQIEALTSTVSIDRVDQELPRTAINRLPGPGESVERGLGPTTVGRDDETRGNGIRTCDIQ